MEQDDEEFEQLLGEIPRATSAPPHLEELQRAYGSELSISPFAVSVGEGGRTLQPVKPFIDIRCDEQYEDFYRAYSGAKKLPPPMENRSLYVEFPVMSPKANSTHVSPFFSGLALDSPRTVAGLRPRQKQQEAQISVTNNLTDTSVRTSSPPPNHHHRSKSSVSVDNRSLAWAFGNLNLEESSGGGLSAVHQREESGVCVAGRGASNRGLDHGIVVGSSLPNGRGAPISTGLYSHLNPFSSGFGSEPASLGKAFVDRSPSVSMELFSQKNACSVSMEVSSNNGSYGTLEGFHAQPKQAFEKYVRRPPPTVMENQLYSSSTRPSEGGMMDGLETSSTAAQVAHQQEHFESAYAAAMAAASIINPGISSPPVRGNDLYSNSGIDYSAASARVSKQQAHRSQFQREAKQRPRERHYTLQQHTQYQQQQMRFYPPLQAHADGVVGSGSNSQPSSRGHSPTGTSARQSSLHQGRIVGVAANHIKNVRNHELLWDVCAGFATQSNDDASRNSAANSICRYYTQGYCSRGDTCPFIHTAVEAFGSGRGTSCSNFEASRAARLLAERGFARLRVASRTATGTTIVAASPVQRRKLESFPNGSLPSTNGHVYNNRNHHTPPVGFHRLLQNHNHLEETLEFNGTGHPIVDAHHLAPLNQQPKYNTLEEVEGRIFSIAKDQHGCRFLQRKFDEGGPEDVQRIFNEIIDHILELMTDPFGNYLVQKLLEVCDEAQRMEILHVVTGKGELVTISLNMHGTRAVQKLIETLKVPGQVAMVIAALKQGVVTLIKDLNGNHVVQRCLQRLSTDESQFIFDATAVHCVEIATHRHGCCVLQRCVDFASGSQRHCLVAEIAANALVLSQDPFGNYVVQYILDLGMTWASVEVMVRLENHYPYLAMQKFSSNVVEKCLQLSTDENRGCIVRELMGSPLLGQMLQDPYANYVVQSALTVTKGSLHTGLVEAIRPHLSVLRSSPYGKRILSRTNLKK